MELNSYFKSVFKGLAWAVGITFFITIIFSIIMNNMIIEERIFNIIYVVISSIGLVIGSVIAVKNYGSKGWIIGLTLGFIFYISLYLIGIIFGAEASLTTYDFFKFILCIFIGLFSGMLGINL